MRPMRKGGSILLVVLWSLFFLALLAAALFAHLRGTIDSARRLDNRVQGYFLARAAVAMAAATAIDMGSNAWHSTHEDWWNDPRRFNNLRVGDKGVCSLRHTGTDSSGHTNTWYGLEDENGRINLNTLPLNRTGYSILKGLFSTAGDLDAIRAGQVAAAIIDWRDTTNGVFEAEPGIAGAENDYYRGRGAGYECRNGPLGSVEELLLVRGIDEALFARVQPCLTVYPSSELININTAGRGVLLALAHSVLKVDPNAAAGMVDAVVKAREDGLVFTNRAAIVTQMENKLSTAEWTILQQIRFILGIQSSHFRAVAEGAPAGAPGERRTIEFILDRNGKIAYWRED